MVGLCAMLNAQSTLRGMHVKPTTEKNWPAIGQIGMAGLFGVGVLRGANDLLGVNPVTAGAWLFFGMLIGASIWAALTE